MWRVRAIRVRGRPAFQTDVAALREYHEVTPFHGSALRGACRGAERGRNVGVVSRTSTGTELPGK